MDRDYFMSCEEGVEFGLIDEVLYDRPESTTASYQGEI